MTLLRVISRLLGLPLLIAVHLYRFVLSPDHSWVRGYYPDGFCRFYPSCSGFSLDGLRTDGILAVPAIFVRLIKCHPWSAGGIHEYHSTLSSYKK